MESDLGRFCEDEANAVWEMLELTGDIEDEAECTIAAQALEERKRVLYPTLYRGSFVMTLWGHLEASIDETADLLRSELKPTPTAFAKMPKESYVDAAVRYFNNELGVPIVESVQEGQELQVLLAVRNTYAHFGGSPKNKAKSQEFDRWYRAGYGPEYDVLRDTLLLSAEYVEQATTVVSGVLTRLADRAEAIVRANE